jgi:hypothetical protein
MNERWLQYIYQQWMQGNDAYMYRWMEFVEMMAKMFSMTPEDMTRELEKYIWFKKGG